jgi:hypothetical protein
MAEASKTPAPRPIGSVLGHARRTLAMVAEVDRGLLVVLLLCQVLDALGLVAIAWVGKQIVDAIVSAINHKGTLKEALIWVGW